MNNFRYQKMAMKNLLYTLLSVSLLFSCAIENDIPYPILEASISSIEVEGQRAGTDSQDKNAIIDKAQRTVTLYVNDSVDITRLKITKLMLDPRTATIGIDSAACVNYEKFPTTDFVSLDSLPLSANTRVNFSKPVTLTLSTYQDYLWKITVNQIVERTVDVVGMTDYVLDANSRNVIIYVGEDQNLSNIQINKLNLGGEYGQVKPDPTTVHDFSTSQTFYAARHGEDTWQEWRVFVYKSDGGGNTGSSETFAMVTKATVKGSIQSGKTPVVEYKKQSDTNWNTVPTANVSVSGTSFTATLTGLTASTTYVYRVNVDGTTGNEQSFTTAAAVPLENGSFDNWSSEAAANGTLWQPWSTTSFWDTGNKGATTIADSNSTPTTETCNGSGKAASLETKWVVLKLAAGNIFTGSYVRTDGTNGVLSFGREFNSFPSKLRINYKYTSATIDKVGDDSLENLKGRPDSCHIYIALTDWDAPLEIRTRPSERQLFNKNDSHVIAYAEYISGSSDAQYKQKDLVLDYRYTNRTPKYILIVASASKYGDYFTGGVGSKLLIDNFELIYD